VNRGVADVFVEAGHRHVEAVQRRLAAFIESLPTEKDRSRFLDAARAFLSFDPEIGSLLPGRRRILLHTEGSDLAIALWQASERLLQEDRPREAVSDLEVELFGVRLLMATLIVGGLQGASDRRALKEAALLLRELDSDAQKIRSKSGGKSGRLDALADNSSQQAQRVALLKTEAEKLRRERPHLRSQRERAAKLNRRFQKQDLPHWSTPGALIEFARRNKIKL